MNIQMKAPSTNAGASASPATEARAPMPATNTYTRVVPIAVAFGSFDAAVVDSIKASVVTSRMRVVVSEKIPAAVAELSAIQVAIGGASAWPTAVTPMTTAARYRYCGIVGA